MSDETRYQNIRTQIFVWHTGFRAAAVATDKKTYARAHRGIRIMHVVRTYIDLTALTGKPCNPRKILLISSREQMRILLLPTSTAHTCAPHIIYTRDVNPD